MKEIEELIRYEIKEVVGCTEPASIAFAFSNAMLFAFFKLNLGT